MTKEKQIIEKDKPPGGGHWSGCAVHNAPAYLPGPCDCGGYDPEKDNGVIDREDGLIGGNHGYTERGI